MTDAIRICKVGDLVGDMYLAIIERKPVAVFRRGNVYRALSNVCPHMGGPLIDGEVDADGVVSCPWHGTRIQLEDGRAPSGSPASVETYAIHIVGDDVYLDPVARTPRTGEVEPPDFRPMPPVASPDPTTLWSCRICSQTSAGTLPPERCPVCAAPSELFSSALEAGAPPPDASAASTYPLEETAVAEYLSRGVGKGEFAQRRIEMWRAIVHQPPIDVLVVSASAHPRHIVSGFIAPKIIEHLRTAHPDLRYDWVDLVKFQIDHNWACYSLEDEFCRFPCNNQQDDMRGIYPKIVRARSLILVTPINWEGMNSRLKVFLDRLTNLQDVPLKIGRADWAGRPVGIFVNGHEDGAYKVAWDVFVTLQNLRYVLAPFGIWYNLSSLTENTNADLERLRTNELAVSRLHKVVDNVVGFMRLRVDRQLTPEPEGEKLRRVHFVAM